MDLFLSFLGYWVFGVFLGVFRVFLRTPAVCGGCAYIEGRTIKSYDFPLPAYVVSRGVCLYRGCLCRGMTGMTNFSSFTSTVQGSGGFRVLRFKVVRFKVVRFMV